MFITVPLSQEVDIEIETDDRYPIAFVSWDGRMILRLTQEESLALLVLFQLHGEEINGEEIKRRIEQNKPLA